ncbi:MAG: amidohydrolase [Acidobacteria bacterium]|nr:MAG: amidohydrolase [Acidobacteriota bacterium]REK01137.1 MAG: amidohydrolase [Acidobacteriota bacterium]
MPAAALDRQILRGPGISLLATVLLLGCAAQEGADTGAADLVVRGGNVITLADPPRAEAVAVLGGEIVFVGSDADAADWVGEGTEVIDLAGATVVPGLIEGHGHYLGTGEEMLQLDLASARRWSDIVAKVEEAAAAATPGEWILGRGWHQEKWDAVPEGPVVEGVPLHASLSAVSPENPVLLTHASGHAAFVNARALDLAGIDASTPDPEGGTIVRDASGAATGLLRETAQGLVAAARGSGFDEARAREAARLAAEEALRHGITSFQDAGSSVDEIRLLQKLDAEGALPVRLWVMIRADNDTMTRSLPELLAVPASETLVLGGIKKSLDGALGSHGAWLLEPYSDLPSTSGLNTVPLSEVEGAAELAREHDLQLCIHAIGDRANREVLDLFEAQFAAEGELPSQRRWRIEHAQHLHPDDIPRFAELGVVASMQGVHCTSDGPWVPQRIGDERAEQGAYVWRKLIDSGARVSNGTDVPVEEIDPLASLDASMTREMPSGEIFYGDQVMTPEEALRSYTLEAAYAAFQEDRKGSIEVGKLGDLTVVSADPLAVAPATVSDLEVLYTIVGGEVAYRGGEE